MGKIKNNQYIVVQGWMVNDLQLKGNELLVFAIIHGFSQDGENRFTGSLQYLADWTSATKQGIMKNLKSLLDKGYIAKEEKYVNGVKFCEYYSTQFTGVLNTVEQGIKQNLTGGIKQSLTNNKDIDNKTDNKRYIFRVPTVEEVADYCRERNNGIDAEQFVDFYSSKGWKVGNNKMQDWKAAVRTWERRRKQTGAGYKKQTKAEELDGFYAMANEWAKS